MIEWEEEADHLRVTDADKAEVTVRGEAFTVTGDESSIPRPVDATVESTARELRFPHSVVYAFSLDRENYYELDPSGEPLTLPEGEYVVDVDAEIKTFLRFSGPATVRKTDDYATIVVSFPERRRTILGFRSRHESPAGTITTPFTPEGLAAAVSHLHSSHKTEKPDRTYPTLRGHPPLLERGENLDVPDRIERSTANSGIELVVPRTIESVFVTAPLAYYLQSTVRTCDRGAPLLRLPDAAVEHDLGSMPELERDAEELLRKTFFLDCLVRNVGPYGTDLSESSLLDALELDAHALYEASPQERLATYLDVPYAAIEHRLPDWHLSTYVASDPSNARTLPFLLDRLSLIYTPRTSELEGKELVERSLDDFYRGGSGSRSSPGKVASVDIVKPELRGGRVHGWLADGVPIDVFKSAPEAYYNRFDYIERGSDATSICVVLNDPEMSGEHTDVADIYRQRSEDRSIDVTVEESLDTAALGRLLESEHDFVHYIGHCEDAGLRCPDGYLSATNLDRCRAQTFFLNACGSFYEGMTLIEKGSVAGAVTFTQVLNDHAVKVGSAFAKLLVNGFSIERAMRLARRRIMMGKDYAVVGDGTHTLTRGEHRLPTTATVERLDEDRFFLELDCFSTQEVGSYYFPHTETNEYAYLCGTESGFALDRDALVAFFKESETRSSTTATSTGRRSCGRVSKPDTVGCNCLRPAVTAYPLRVDTEVGENGR